VASHLFTQYEGVPFVDPVTPICRWLKTDGRYHQVGVMATDATVASNRYPKLLGELQSSIVLTQVACGNLATLIEEGQGDSPACDAALRKYLQPLKAKPVEAIVLGCTHYPYVMDQVAALAPECEILDPSVFMALETKALLAQHGLASNRHTGRAVAEVDYFVTAEPDRFYETSLRMPFQALAMKQPTVISTAVTQSLSF
jgi:glutamate racemase